MKITIDEQGNCDLIVLDPNGLEYKEPGTYEAEKVWQMELKSKKWLNMVESGEDELFRKNYPKNTYRQVYILTPNPTLEGKEEEKQTETLTSHQAMLNALDEDLILTVIPSIKEAAMAMFTKGILFGINECKSQAKNSGLISKDAVINAIKDYYNNLHSWEDDSILKILQIINEL